MPRLKLPTPATDELQLADWLELYAIKSPDGDSSFQDLERAIRRAGVMHDDDEIEEKMREISNELQSRALAADHSYPFELGDRSISLRGDVADYLPYIFCLYLSWAAGDPTLNQLPYPRRLFEDLCSFVAGNYIGGDFVRFAWPRRAHDIPSGFGQAIDELCARIGEGGGYKERRTHSQKDDAIDVFAWRHFPDRSDGKLLLVGNCASGRDWGDKLDELQPDTFCKTWMADYPHSMVNGIKAIFVPRRCTREEWHEASSHIGMVFDRCRIAFYANGARALASGPTIQKWAKRYLKGIV